jgi:hypothetical protein
LEKTLPTSLQDWQGINLELLGWVIKKAEILPQLMEKREPSPFIYPFYFTL